MNRIALLSIVFISLQISLFGWTGGYRVTLEGFSSLEHHEYLGAHLMIDPRHGTGTAPFISAGILFPVFDDQDTTAYAEVSAGLTLLQLRDHPMERRFLRPSSLAPRILAGVLMPGFKAQDLLITAEAQPLSFYFGGRTVSVMGLRAVIDPREPSVDWGVRFFDITHYLF